MHEAENPPFALYQSVDIDADIDNIAVSATTVLWLGFKKSLQPDSFINLHCRQCDIKEIYINNIPADFVYNDGLKTICSPKKKPCFLAEELDSCYRASLETARAGELRVVVPDLSQYQNRGSTDLPQPIPRSSPRDVIDRYEKLVRAYSSLTATAGGDYSVSPTPRSTAAGAAAGASVGRSASYDASPQSSPASAHSVGGSSEESAVGCGFLIQIKIAYDICRTADRKLLSGIVFRQQPAFAASFARNMMGSTSTVVVAAGGGDDKRDNQSATATTVVATRAVQCVYTTTATNGSLRDLDGVRCWLPCLDSLDQRLVFDIRIKAPRDWRIACCGKKISTYLLPARSSTSATTTATTATTSSANGATTAVGAVRKKISRFFTPIRIPAANVGFFIGGVEMHKMSLYRLRSRIWVASGLQDVVCHSPSPAAATADEVSSATRSGNNGGSGNSSSLGGSKRDRNSKTDGSQGETDEEIVGLEPPMKIPKTADEPIFSSSLRVEKPYSFTAAAATDATSLMRSAIEVAESQPRRLYFDKVHHSMLGLDMATRILHKFCGHKHDYDEFSFVFVADLGADFAAFDGFALIDARFLHDASQIYLETAAHLLLLRAYLYAWFKSSLPISSYESEFIVHGAVEYLVNYYCEEVFGEDDARFRYQKQYDTVVAIEKQGRALPLWSFFPECYERFDVHFGQYLIAKSAVIYQLLENRVSGKDPMRIALKQLIRSPGIYAAAAAPVRQYKGATKEIVNNFQSLFDSTGIALPNATPPTPSMVDFALRQQQQQGMSLQEQLLRQKLRQQPSGLLYTNEEDASSIGAASPYTPSLAAGTPFSAMGAAAAGAGSMSPYSPYSQHGGGTNLSPYPYAGGSNMSPYPIFAAAGSNTPSGHVAGSMSPYGSYYIGSRSPYNGVYNAAAATAAAGTGANSPAIDPYAVAAEGPLHPIAGAAGAKYDVSYSPAVDVETRFSSASASDATTTATSSSAMEESNSGDDVSSNDSSSSNDDATAAEIAPTTEASIAVRESVTFPVVLHNEASEDRADAAITTSKAQHITAATAVENSESTSGFEAAPFTTQENPESAVAVEAETAAAGAGYYASMARQQAMSMMAPPSSTMTTAAAGSTLAAAANKGDVGDEKVRHMKPPLLARNSSNNNSGGYTPSLLPSLKLQRHQSITSEGGWERDFSLLASDCVSAETFIELVRHASGATADVDKSFLEKYVYSSGVSFVRYHACISQKVDNKPRYMYVTSDQVGYKQFGSISADCCQQRTFLMRIAESRHDMMTEPLITVGKETEQYTRQAFARAGGRRRRSAAAAGSSGRGGKQSLSSPAEAALKAKLDAQKEIRKSALQKSRDMDHQLKYVVLDPLCQEIVEVQNASADCLLIEQLYNDFSENCVFFQCQALRSLSRSIVSASSIMAAAAAAASAVDNQQSLVQLGDAGIDAMTAAQEEDSQQAPEKTARLQIKAFLDCLLAAPTNVSDSKTLSGTQFSVFVRAEAAFCLARWQNNNAPKDLSPSVLPMMWQGLHYLLKCISEMYTDAITLLPVANDFTNESDTYLRNALLLAAAEIKARSGHTPLEVVEMLLLFAEFSDKNVADLFDDADDGADSNNVSDSEDDHTAAAITSSPWNHTHNRAVVIRSISIGSSRSRRTKESDRRLPAVGDSSNRNSKSIRAQYDHCYYKAVLFHALSKVRFDNVSLQRTTATTATAVEEQDQWQVQHPIEQIAELAAASISAAFTQARALARINFSCYESANSLPSLSSSSVEVAAAICCLGQLDVNAVQLLSQEKIPRSARRMRTVDFEGPTERGPFTEFNFLIHFLPSDAKMNCLYAGEEDKINHSSNANGGSVSGSIDNDGSGGGIKREVLFQLCSPLVRAAAFEAFVRICFAMHVAFIERYEARDQRRNALRQQQQQQSIVVVDEETGAVPEVTYIAAAVEALTLVLKHDPDRWVQQQAASSLADAVMGKPPRVIPQALSQSNYWCCSGWSDPCAVTQQLHPHFDDVPASAALLQSRFIDASMLSKTFTSTSSSSSSGNSRKGNALATARSKHQPYKVCMHCTGKYMTVALRLLWRTINNTAEYDQLVRSTLLLCWRYAFDCEKPPVFAKSSSSWQDPFFEHSDLGSIGGANWNRLVPVQRPADATRQFEQALIYGPEYRDRAKHDAIAAAVNPTAATAASATAVGSRSSLGAVVTAAPARLDSKTTGTMRISLNLGGKAVDSNSNSSSSGSNSSSSSNAATTAGGGASKAAAISGPTLKLSLK